MKANCLNCNTEIKYSPSQKRGKYCSNRCQADLKIKKRFCEGTKWNWNMSKYLKRIKGNRCESCDIQSWMNKELTMHVDHIDGNRTNNKIENLKILCPNCHSQTETFGHKNVSTEGRVRMIASANKNRKFRALSSVGRAQHS